MFPRISWLSGAYIGPATRVDLAKSIPLKAEKAPVRNTDCGNLDNLRLDY